jgi:hypothetical protein
MNLGSATPGGRVLIAGQSIDIRSGHRKTSRSARRSSNPLMTFEALLTGVVSFSPVVVFLVGGSFKQGGSGLSFITA